jgi:hypothetical protein
VMTSFATVGAPASSRLPSHSPFRIITSHTSTRNPRSRDRR